MSFPGIIRRLFANDGAGPLLRKDIIPCGTTAATVCQGDDARVVNAVPKSRKVNAGTGLSGGGDLNADRTFAVNFGSAAGTVCQGNDARLTNARPPQGHKATHKTGGADALTPADIGAAAASVSISAGNGLTANRSLAVNFGTTAGTACQGNDTRLTGAVNSVNALNGSVNVLNTWRKQWIGVPRWWRSTTLPPHHIWADGTLVLFADWPEFKAVYDAGGFNGMLLEANATAAQISANLGKWKKHPNNLGLYAPQLGGQFFRGWGTGANGQPGTWQADAMRAIAGTAAYIRNDGGGSALQYCTGVFTKKADSGNVAGTSVGSTIRKNCDIMQFDTSLITETGPVTVPPHIWLPCVVYIGTPR